MYRLFVHARNMDICTCTMYAGRPLGLDTEEGDTPKTLGKVGLSHRDRCIMQQVVKL